MRSVVACAVAALVLVLAMGVTVLLMRGAAILNDEASGHRDSER